MVDNSGRQELGERGRGGRSVTNVQDDMSHEGRSGETHGDPVASPMAAVLQWMVTGAAGALNRHAMGHSGKMALQRAHRTRAVRDIVVLGESILYIPLGSARKRDKLDPRWKYGVFIGISALSNEAQMVIGGRALERRRKFEGPRKPDQAEPRGYRSGVAHVSAPGYSYYDIYTRRICPPHVLVEPPLQLVPLTSPQRIYRYG